MNVKVIDLNEEVKTEEATLQPIEEEQVADFLNSNKVGVEQPEIVNEAVEEVKEKNEVVEEVSEKPKEVNDVVEKPKRQTQKDKITCGKCGKEMTIKSYKYSHEKKAKGNYQKDQ